MKLQRTVIVPAYNAADTLQACLGAVLSPADQSQQIIVVDDGSTDRTAQIARKAGAHVVAQRRQGPAAARNAGARLATADILVFIDSDVVVRPGAIDRMLEALEADPELAAVFGSYDSTPRVRGAIATYRNLLHAYTHQQGAEEATTFWAGLGAVRRELFELIGGFNSRKFESASIEDIEFGMRLIAAGHRIRLDRQALGTHCKEWTLSSMVRTDLWCRAVPWTRLLRQCHSMPNDLNLRWSQRVSVVTAWLVPPALAVIALDWRLIAIPISLLVLHMALNAPFFTWVLRRAGARAAAAAVPLQLLFHWIAGLGFLIGNLTSAPAEASTPAERGAART